ncbi:MAG TPA: hypothetical protein PKV41_03135 [Candidatus Omnitrophota bacterium]|nr:hypothetical protein [Candidatus Omnitrophota bacterium]
MSSEFMLIILIAAFTGITHTLLGPDHYLPFIALAKSQSWSRKRTAWITCVCGLGHILSSVVIAYLALGLRFSLNLLEVIDSYRSDFTAWALIAFGLVYLIAGLKRIYRSNVQETVQPYNPMFWILFVIFVVGPCEPLFFLMTYPSLAGNLPAVLLLIGVFGATTIMTMLAAVFAASFGLGFLRGRQVMRFAPAASGMIIIFCGVGIKFLGL